MAVHIQRFGAAGAWVPNCDKTLLCCCYAGGSGMVWSRYSFTILAAKIYYVVLNECFNER